MEGRWWKLGEESVAAYRAFVAYRELGPGRTVAAVAGMIPGRGGGHLRRWSDRFRWVERAAAWDEHERQHALAGANERTEIERRLPGLVLLLLNAATASLARIAARGDASLAECLEALAVVRKFVADGADQTSSDDVAAVESLLSWVLRQRGG